jgi:predicted DsbA family dithiol-disulfide isomerase
MLTLFHDYTSPASAVAVARLQRLIDEGATAAIVGTEAIGLATTLPVTVELLAELDAVADAAASEGLVLRRPSLLPPTAAAHLVEDVAVGHGLAATWRRRCYDAYWSQGTDIAAPDALRAVAAEVGLPADEVAATLADRVALASIRRRFAGHRRNGIGGVPMISYDGTLVPGLLDDDDLRTLAAL